MLKYYFIIGDKSKEDENEKIVTQLKNPPASNSDTPTPNPDDQAKEPAKLEERPVEMNDNEIIQEKNEIHDDERNKEKKKTNETIKKKLEGDVGEKEERENTNKKKESQKNIAPIMETPTPGDEDKQPLVEEGGAKKEEAPTTINLGMSLKIPDKDKKKNGNGKDDGFLNLFNFSIYSIFSKFQNIKIYCLKLK